MKKALLAAFLIAGVSSSSEAATYVFSFTSSANVVLASGSLTTADTLNTLGGYNVLSLTGSVGGEAITGLIADPYNPKTGYYLSDGTISSSLTSNAVLSFNDVLYLTEPHLDTPGLLFETASEVYNVYYGTSTNAQYKLANFAIGSSAATAVDGTFSISAAAVPEAATWAMMIVGMGMIGFTVRRRQNVKVVYADC